MEVFNLLFAAGLWPVYQHPLIEMVVLHQAVREAHPVRAHGVASAVVVVCCSHASSALGEKLANARVAKCAANGMCKYTAASYAVRIKLSFLDCRRRIAD